MAEVLGIVASGISVASLTIQIADSLSKAISFCESIREAPADVERLIVELHLLSSIISVIQSMVTIGSVPATIEPVLQRALTLVRHDATSLSIISTELDRKLKSESRLVRTWARVQTVFSEKKILLLKSHLERAKGGLQLLQGCIVVERVSNVDSMARQIPKQLGYHWEAGERERHIQVDDGLDEPFYVPIDLCSNPEDLTSLLEIKYKSRNLPGLYQIRQGHLAVFDWKKNINIDSKNWNMVVRPGGQIRIAFLMSSWHGLPRTKCIRCFKPYKNREKETRFRDCSSCGLEVLKVDPEAIAFEIADIEIGYSADKYRDYQLSKRYKLPTRKKDSGSLSSSGVTAASKLRSTSSNSSCDDPSIDLVCKRLMVKWEPMFNLAHRYLYCRCILRMTTPSKVEKEQTLLVFAACPRHNMNNTSRRDYGNVDYLSDIYFDKFGGYRAFQGFIYMFSPNVYQILGEEKFLPAEDLEEAVSAINERKTADSEGLMDVFFEYYFEVNDAVEKAGIELPEREAKFLELERKKRTEQLLASYKSLGVGRGFELSEEQQRQFVESPMMQEFREILDGKWNGKPHWEIAE